VSYTFTAPQVIADLLAALASALPGTDVLDGPVVSAAPLPEAVTVGFQDGEAGIQAITAELTKEQYADNPLREQYTVNCSIAVIAATGVTSEARARCFELLALVNDVLAADETSFTVPVLSAQLGRYSLNQFPGSRGMVVQLNFGIDVDAFTQQPVG
jgi:hypothetical protein